MHPACAQGESEKTGHVQILPAVLWFHNGMRGRYIRGRDREGAAGLVVPGQSSLSGAGTV
jgi:hypothetical protein